MFRTNPRKKMKKFLYKLVAFTLIASAVQILSLSQIASADYTVIPAPPYNRQFSFEIEPSSKDTASVLIKNLGNGPVTLNLYSADATQSSQGTFALSSKTTTQWHVGNWISFEEPTVTVPAMEELSVPFVVNVPESATPGSYAGGIAVELAKNGPDTTEEYTAPASAVTISSRFIVKLFVKVPGEKKHTFTWEDFKFDYANDTNHARFVFDVKNSGNTIVMMDPKVELVGFPPLKNSIIELPTATFQPSNDVQTISLRFLEKPPVGFYFVKGTASFYEYDFLSDKKITPQVETRDITINLTPWYVAVIIVIVILLLIISPIIWYRRTKKYIIACTEYQVVEGDTVISIAEKERASWKKIAKLNKLKPPYTLQTGKKILIPPKK